MNSKLSLILFGALITLAVLSAAENMEENSLSEEIASSRLARAADADPGKRKRNKKSKRKNKASKKNKSKKKSTKNKSKRKSKKAEKKKNKKNKKAEKKKNKKASRKSKKKSKINKSKRKSKKAEKKKNKKATRKNKSNTARQSSTVPDTCLSTAVNTLYNGLSKKASNFDRQLKRIEARLPKIESKRGKAGDYNQTMDDLIAANASGCPAGNQSLLMELMDLVGTLGECQTNIETDCATPMINQTQIDECKPIVEGFVAEVEKCFGLNSDPAAACVCWESDAMAELEMGLKGCVIKESEANVTAGFKACKGAVSTCNKAQTESIPVLVVCSKTEADLVAEAELIANNIASLSSAKTSIESTAAARMWYAAKNCTEYIVLIEMLVTLSPESPKIAEIAHDIVGSFVTCTDEEKDTLAISVIAIDEVINEAVVALESIQVLLELATGSTAAIETTALVYFTTTAAPRMRMRGFKKQLNFKM